MGFVFFLSTAEIDARQSVTAFRSHPLRGKEIEPQQLQSGSVPHIKDSTNAQKP